MKKLDDRKRRFDETFKTLLVIVTITTTFSFNLYKDALGNVFFVETFMFFVASVIIWSFFNLVDGTYEYIWKLLAWHFLIFTMVVSFMRIISGQLLIHPVLGFVILIVILYPTSWIKRWLEEIKAIPTGTMLSRNFFILLGVWTAYQISQITFIR